MPSVDLEAAQGDILAQVSMLCQIAGRFADGGVDRCLSSTAGFINHIRRHFTGAASLLCSEIICRDYVHYDGSVCFQIVCFVFKVKSSSFLLRFYNVRITSRKENKKPEQYFIPVYQAGRREV